MILLKPCPFCGMSDLGSSDVSDDKGHGTMIVCRVCDTEGPIARCKFPTPSRARTTAKKFWNHRPVVATNARSRR